MTIQYSDRIRPPEPEEAAQRLWVDRIGAKPLAEDGRPEFFRCLGLYAAVAVVTGGGFYETPEERRALGPGDVIMLFPDEPARYWSEGVWRTEWLVWGGEEMARLVERGYFSPSQPIVPAAAPQVLDAIRDLRQLSSMHGIELEKKLIVMRMLLELHRRMLHPGAGAIRARLEEKLAALKLEAHESPPVEEAARRCGMSAVHFRRQLKAAFGMSPSQYFLRRRMAAAQELLNSGAAVKEVSDRLGFCNEFHFRRKFRAYYGYPPGFYAKLLD